MRTWVSEWRDEKGRQYYRVGLHRMLNACSRTFRPLFSIRFFIFSTSIFYFLFYFCFLFPFFLFVIYFNFIFPFHFTKFFPIYGFLKPWTFLFIKFKNKFHLIQNLFISIKKTLYFSEKVYEFQKLSSNLEIVHTIQNVVINSKKIMELNFIHQIQQSSIRYLQTVLDRRIHHEIHEYFSQITEHFFETYFKF